MKLAMLLIMLQVPATSGPMAIDWDKATQADIVRHFDDAFGAPRFENEKRFYDGAPAYKQTRTYDYKADEKASFCRNLVMVMEMGILGHFLDYESLPLESIAFEIWVPRRTTLEELDRMVLAVLGVNKKRKQDEIIDRSRFPPKLLERSWQRLQRRNSGVYWATASTKIDELLSAPDKVAMRPDQVKEPSLSNLKLLRKVGVYSSAGSPVEGGQSTSRLHFYSMPRFGEISMDCDVNLDTKTTDVPKDYVQVRVSMQGFQNLPDY